MRNYKHFVYSPDFLVRTGQHLPWHYVLLAENVLYEWQGKGAHLAKLLDYARLRPLADASRQGRLI